jgi:hypothetical protein
VLLFVLRDCNQAQCRDRIIRKVKEIGWEGVDWIDLAQDRNKYSAVGNAVMNLPGSIKRGVFLD